MMTDKEWHDVMAEVHSLRFQLIHNIVPATEREKMRAHLVALLEKLASTIREDKS